MVEQRTISVCIPSYNRVSMTIDAFEKVYHDPRISEIVIVDDASDWGIFTELKNLCEVFSKVRLYRNLNNRDCYFNKMVSISYAINDWCILLDSDNQIDDSYIEKLFAIPEWDERTIYTPSFAAPQFDFRPYENLLITKENVSEYIDKPMFETMLNAANYFVNKCQYLAVWDNSTDPVTSDSIFQCYNWIKAGNKIKVVAGLEYNHRVHEGHYRTNVHRTPIGFHENILQKLKNMA